jgi:predicted MPP superfamily phosphohydrolase
LRSRLFIFISIVQSILLLGHAFIYTAASYFWGGAASSWQFKLAMAVLSISFVSASLIGWYSHNSLVRVLYLLAAVWLGFAALFLLAAILCWIVYAFRLLLDLGWAQPHIADACFGIAVAAGLYGILNAAALRVTRINVVLENLPEQWRGRTAVLVSDLHLGHIRNGRFIRRVVRRISALKPEVVFIAGDLYDGVAADFTRLAIAWKDLIPASARTESFATAIPKIAPPLGVYYIAGNHEEFYQDTEYLPPLLSAGIRVLNNEKVELDGLQLIGVHYRDAANPNRYQAILQQINLDRRRPSILLLHAPVRLQMSEAAGISLQLSGHTHGGQFFPGTLVGKRVWGKFNHGLQSLGKMLVYVTYGAGTWGPPMRIGTKPEVVLITFK